MKDTRKLSVVYFVISLVMLLLVCIGCSRYELDYIHSYNDCDVFYVETDNPEEVVKAADRLLNITDNFVLQSDFGIIEAEDGEVVYNNITK